MTGTALPIKSSRRLPTGGGSASEPARMTLRGETATAALAASLARLARRGDVFALSGDLGSGKTAFARAFIHARTATTEEVPSPTFTLVQVYPAAGAGEPDVYHFDLFRLTGPQDVDGLGLEEALADGISLIEWPDRLQDRLPAHRLDVVLAYGDGEEERLASLIPHQGWDLRLKEAGLV